jgi:DNA-binding MarR family transcriptional regulator
VIDPVQPSHQDLGIQLGLGFAAFVERLDAEMAAAGFDDLGRTYGYMFRALADGPSTLSALAASLRMTTQGAAKILDEMQARGYVRRLPHPTDARSRQIDLAPRGRDALATARGLHARFEQELTARTSPGTTQALRSALTAVIEMGDVDPASRLLRPI